MSVWKRKAARLGLDFRLNRHEILAILRATEKQYSDCKMPLYYKGNREKYLYDKAKTQVINKACA